jgi:hypothetical protein
MRPPESGRIAEILCSIAALLLDPEKKFLKGNIGKKDRL